jgi:uncharacterized ferredoxin-like protein
VAAKNSGAKALVCRACGVASSTAQINKSFLLLFVTQKEAFPFAYLQIANGSAKRGNAPRDPGA